MFNSISKDRFEQLEKMVGESMNQQDRIVEQANALYENQERLITNDIAIKQAFDLLQKSMNEIQAKLSKLSMEVVLLKGVVNEALEDDDVDFNVDEGVIH